MYISDVISKEVDLGINLINYAPLDNLQTWIEKIEKRSIKFHENISPKAII